MDIEHRLTRLERLDTDVFEIKSKVSSIDSRFSSLERRVEAAVSKLDALDMKVWKSNLDGTFDRMTTVMVAIALTSVVFAVTATIAERVAAKAVAKAQVRGPELPPVDSDPSKSAGVAAP